jgi:hypothetical protein
MSNLTHVESVVSTAADYALLDSAKLIPGRASNRSLERASAEPVAAALLP